MAKVIFGCGGTVIGPRDVNPFGDGDLMERAR